MRFSRFLALAFALSLLVVATLSSSPPHSPLRLAAISSSAPFRAGAEEVRAERQEDARQVKLAAEAAAARAAALAAQPSTSRHVPPRQPTTRPGAHASNGDIEACIAQRESGGNYYPHDNPTHFGKYQYDRQTWAAHGGKPAEWGTASPAEQERVFRNGVSQFGYGAWTPYDGC